MQDFLIRLGLRFESAEEERRFVSSFALDDLWRTQAAMVLGAFVYYSFTLWDWILNPAVWVQVQFIRLILALGFLLPMAALLYTEAGRRRAEFVFLAFCVVPGCVLSIIYRIVDPGFGHTAAGMILIVLFVATSLPMRTLFFATFCLTTWAGFAVAEWTAVHGSAGLHVVNNFYMAFAYTMALYAVVVREYRARRQFRTTAELQREKARSDATLVALKSAQAHLVQAEKHAALGQLVAGVAHEVNTPIGIALTTATAIEADVRGLARTVASGQVRRSDLTRGVERLGEGSRILFANLSRAADLVHSFKQVAVDQANEERRRFDLGQWLHELLHTLGPLLRRRGHEVAVDCPEGIVLDSHPGALAQVISNLALNAVTHAYPDGRHGQLRLAVTRPDDSCLRLDFSDDGAGIAPDHLGKVFDPFFTTRRDQGSTGLGLHIVFNLVVATLKGTIAMESAPGAGTRFTIVLPLNSDGATPAGAALAPDPTAVPS